MSAADRVEELRARSAARAAERAALDERRQYGLARRHAAKLAYLAAREEREDDKRAPAAAEAGPGAEPEVA